MGQPDVRKFGIAQNFSGFKRWRFMLFRAALRQVEL
jgi:hypothetical protein